MECLLLLSTFIDEDIDDNGCVVVVVVVFVKCFKFLFFFKLFNLPTFGNRDLDFVSLNFVDFISFNVEQCFCVC